MCCGTCVSLDKERKELKQDDNERYCYGCKVQGVICGYIASDQELGHLSCGDWEANDERKRDNSSMAAEFEHDLQILYARWRQIYEYGGLDLNCPDGCELNHLRGDILSRKHQITCCLLKEDYPASYYLSTPSLVDDQYMARKEEIMAAALQSLKIYEASEDYQWLYQEFPDLSEKERKRSGICYAIGHVERLNKAIEQKDYILMRAHESPEYYVECLKTCCDKVTQLLQDRGKVGTFQKKEKADKNTKGELQIPGQMDIFSFLAS
jgi:hypothetical protein